MGFCSGCGSRTPLVEAPTQKSAGRRGRWNPQAISEPVELSEVKPEAQPRVTTGCGEMDRVLGGGLVPGSLTLFAGEPGGREIHAAAANRRGRCRRRGEGVVRFRRGVGAADKASLAASGVEGKRRLPSIGNGGGRGGPSSGGGASGAGGGGFHPNPVRRGGVIQSGQSFPGERVRASADAVGERTAGACAAGGARDEGRQRGGAAGCWSTW